jgi:bifunctional DNA-binding transcriptional regulator/antitoxin component of YhaV-PrlF toxin-antitoxin module
MKKPLQVKLRKIGTSYGVIIPKKVLDSMNVSKEDTLIIKDMEPLRQLNDIRGMLPKLTFRREHGTDRF